MPLLNLSEILAPSNDQVPALTPTHYLYLLGTDTKFTNAPTSKRDYQRGETLSYTALAITALLHETSLPLQKDKTCLWDALSYCAPSVEVLDGADTMGHDVGKRIAQAIFLALRAVSKGKTVLQITGHSRGAVESILLMHELFRIKNALNDSPEKSLLAVLKESTCTMTSDAIGNMFPKVSGLDDTPENRMRLKERLDSLVIHSFLIDPVPGGGVIHNWDDPRFYQPLPEFCKHSEYLICEDERSNYFEPIIPPGVTPNIVPGHHGTASGNRYTQQMSETPNWKPEYTTNVQDLVLLKFFWFIEQSNKAFLVEPVELNLGHADLDKVINDYLKLTSLEERQTSLLAYYNKIAIHKDHYKVFRTAGYSMVGIKSHSDGSRLVCTNSRTALKSLSSITQVMPKMVNIEHVKLSLDQILPNSSLREEGVDGMIALITNALDALGQSVKPEPTMSLIHHALESELGQSTFIENISILVDSISQKYLNNNLTREEKTKLMDGVKIPFEQLIKIRKFDLSENANQLLMTFENILKNRINQTMDRRYTTLSSEAKELSDQVQLFLEHPAKFAQMFVDLQTKEVYQILPESIKSAIQTLNPVNVPGLLKVISELSENDAAEIVTLLNNDAFTQVQQYFDAYRHDADQYLSKIQQVHDEISSLEKTHPVFASLAGQMENAIKAKQFELMLLIQNMERLAGTLLKDKNYDLSQKPMLIAQDFFDAAKQQAIACGAVSPKFTEQQTEHLKKIQKLQLDHDQQIRIIQQKAVLAEESAQREEFASIHEAIFKPLKEQQMHDQQSQRATILMKLSTSLEDEARRDKLAMFQESSSELLNAHITSEQQLQQATFMSQQKSISETETVLRANVVAIQESALELLKAQQTITQFQQVIVASQQERLLGEKEALMGTEQIQFDSILQIEMLQLENLKNCRERDEMIAHLNSDSEIKAASLIQNKLTPLTETYMRHLDEKHLNNRLDARITDKKSIVKKLMDHLKNDKVLPSERIRLFREELTKSNTKLTAHRCPDWVQFVKKCLNVLAILATLVIPVMAYSQATGQSPLFFSQSKGERYSKACTHQLS